MHLFSTVGGLFLVVASSLAAAQSSGQTFFVTNIDALGKGSFYQAVQDANNNGPGEDRILFQTNHFDSIKIDPVFITSTILVEDDRPSLTVSIMSNRLSQRPINVIQGGRLTLRNIEINGGLRGNNDFGACVLVRDAASLRIENSSINSCRSGRGGVYFSSTGTLDIVNSSFRSNEGFSTFGNTSGAIYMTSGTLNVVNSTFYGNSATTNAAFSASAIHLTSSAIGTISNSTFGFNGFAPAVGSVGEASIHIRSSIIARSGFNSVDVVGNFTSGGYNLIGNTGSVTAFIMPFDQVGTSQNLLDPRFAQPEINTYSTALPLLATSPAIDKGSSAGLLTDQLGRNRRVDIAAISNADDGSDIGALELNDQFFVSGFEE
jgi:hypothetical protein